MDYLIPKLHGHQHGCILKQSLVLNHLDHLLWLRGHVWLKAILVDPVYAGLDLIVHNLLLLLLLDLLILKVNFFANFKLLNLVHDPLIILLHFHQLINYLLVCSVQQVSLLAVVDTSLSEWY